MPSQNFDAFREMASSFAFPTEDADVVLYDIELDSANLQEQVEKTLATLEICSPYGEANPEPVFLIRNVQLLPKDGKVYKLMGNHNQHIKMFGKNIDFVAFDLSDKFFEFEEPTKIDLVGMLGKNYFNGNVYYQIEVLDFMPAEKKEVTGGLLNRLAGRAIERR